MRCYECEKANMKKKKVEFELLGVKIGRYDAFVCPSCGETVFEPKASQQIEKRAKELGVWGLARKSRIGTSGTALDIKIPKQIVEFLELKKGQEIIIEPLSKKKLQIVIEN